jgi:predicted RNase H-like nuclease (RuvC/YqgF family)
MAQDDNSIVSIDKMIEKFKSESELKAYCNVQFKTISNLNKKIKDKDEEIEHLKQLLEKNTQLYTASPEGIITESTDAEQICRTQIRRLRDQSMNRELTLEESKKVEIFAKLLLQQNNKKDSADEDQIKKMSPEELIKLVKMDDGK